MAYQTLYLRWRPAGFDTLVGQEPVKTALRNALETGRIAHAYLFTGPRGTGKTTTARIFAKALNCEHGPTADPCGTCLNCTQIADGSAMDVQELDAASNRGVEDIKNLNKNADFAPVNCRYKVYIIDEAHMLTTEACNALLKTLEEPPEHVVFILATTEPHKILPTIHSRCQRFDFHPITREEITAHLRKVADGSDIPAEDSALDLIAAVSEGGMRDALSLLEQCGVMADRVTEETVRQVRGIVGREILRKLVGAIGQRNVAECLTILDDLVMQGKDYNQILLELSLYFRSLLLFKAVSEYQPIYVVDTAEGLQEMSPHFGGERLMEAQEIIHNTLTELRNTSRSRIAVEMCLYDLCREGGRTVRALAARVEELERQLAALTSGQVAIPTGNVTAAPAQPVQTAAPAARPAQIAPAAPVQQTQSAQPAPRTPAAQPAQPAQQQMQPAAPAAPASPAQTPRKPATQPPRRQEPPKTASGGQTAPRTAPGATAPVPAYTPYGGDWADGDELWNKALNLLRQEKKMSVASCANTGQVLSFENHELVVGFKSDFFSDRMNRDDYRKLVEEAMLRLSRISVRLKCVVGSLKQGVSLTNKPRVKAPSAPARPQTQRPAARQQNPRMAAQQRPAAQQNTAPVQNAQRPAAPQAKPAAAQNMQRPATPQVKPAAVQNMQRPAAPQAKPAAARRPAPPVEPENPFEPPLPPVPDDSMEPVESVEENMAPDELPEPVIDGEKLSESTRKALKMFGGKLEKV